MPLRRRAWLSREGWYYCGVLAFIVGGAVLRSINLLVILAGMMLAPIILNWRLVMAGMWGLIVRRTLPEQICAGEPLTVEIQVENTRRRMSSWLVSVEDWVERDEEQETGDRRQGTGVRSQGTGDRGQESGIGGRRSEVGYFALRTQYLVRSTRQFLRSVFHNATRTRAETLIPVIGPQEKVTATYRITLHQRGRYRFGPLRVSTRFPLGLVIGQFTLYSSAEVIVAPRLGRLSPEWTRLLEADQAGDQRRQPQRGYAEGDYYGLRPWQSGDSTRWIHWRSTAKTGVPTVLQFERQRNRDVALVLDPWLPDRPTDTSRGILELAISLAATAVADLARRGHSRIVFAVAGERADCWSGPASGLFCQELLAQLAVLPASGGHTLAEAIAQARDHAPAGARLLVISTRRPLADLPGADSLAWIDASSESLGELLSIE